MEAPTPSAMKTMCGISFESGLRIVGLTWKEGTRYAGGNARPGPLTRDGADMVKTLDRFGIIARSIPPGRRGVLAIARLDFGPIMASHSNCRSIVPGERQLSDEMIRAITFRGGMIGINFYDKFLIPPEEQANRRANLRDVTRHIKHICDIAGDAACVGLGTDMDGGLGRNEIPVEIETSADLPSRRRCPVDRRLRRPRRGRDHGRKLVAIFSKKLGIQNAR